MRPNAARCKHRFAAIVGASLTFYHALTAFLPGSAPRRLAGWFNPADRTITAAVNHIMHTGSGVLEQQGIGVA